MRSRAFHSCFIKHSKKRARWFYLTMINSLLTMINSLLRFFAVDNFFVFVIVPRGTIGGFMFFAFCVLLVLWWIVFFVSLSGL